MSDAQAAAPGTDTPAAAPAPVPTPAPETPPAQPDAAWLAPRLEQAKRTAENAILAQLGVKDAAEAKAALDAYKAAQDAAKTEAERVAARLAEGEAAKARAAQLEVAVGTHADAEMGKLDDAKRAAVMAIAGDDKAAQLRAIAALAPTWSAPAATPPAPVATAAAPPAAATTAHPPTAPVPTTATQTDVDHKAVFDGLVKAGKGVAASRYLNAHAREIYPER